MKKLVEIAGGVDDLANPGRPSYIIEWERILGFAPEIMVLTCCGYKLPKVIQEAQMLLEYDGIDQLPAIRNNRVYATNGSDYFSRPGPRIIDSLEILAHLIHPEIFSAPPFPEAFSNIDLSRTVVGIQR